MKTPLALLSLATALAAPVTARADWQGLADGSYAVTLNCTFSSQIDCSQPIGGTITVSGSGLSAMDFDIDAQTFAGDPTDAVVDGNLVDTESSQVTLTPFAFLSLRLITAGSIGNFVAGDRWWVYCNNSSPSTCTPNTTGLWTATPLATVDEPSMLATLAVAGLLGWRLRRGRRAAPQGVAPAAATPLAA